MMIIRVRRFYIISICFIVISSTAQNRRYLDPIFNEVEISDPIELAQNYTILKWIKSGGSSPTIKQSLFAQLYTPKGDTKTDRPLIIYVHTGNFLPFPENGYCSGTLMDSSNVEIATRLAKMGYVVAVVTYRQGWNPISPILALRRFYLINAMYRAMQDIRSYIRYFKKSFVELNNPYGINPSQITVWGERTGGFIALAAAYFNDFSEFHPPNESGKFLLPTVNGNISIIDENYNGNIYGDGPITTVDETYHMLTGLYIGDTLSIPNHTGYSSDFALTVNMGGSLADSSWLNKGEMPLISYHVSSDFLFPCYTNFSAPPNYLLRELYPSGSCDLARISDRFGNNDIFKIIPTGQDYYEQFNKSGYSGFYEFRNTPENIPTPWEWSRTDDLISYCSKNTFIAKKYIDTIVGYFAPRACVALGLHCDFNSSVKDHAILNVNINMAPNPAITEIFISVSDETPIKSYTIFDISGRMIRNYNNINSSTTTLKREDLQNGLYLVKLQFEEGSLTKKVVFE